MSSSLAHPRLYSPDTETGSLAPEAPVWTSQLQAISVLEGVFQVSLGSGQGMTMMEMLPACGAASLWWHCLWNLGQMNPALHVEAPLFPHL